MRNAFVWAGGGDAPVGTQGKTSLPRAMYRHKVA